MSLDLPELLPQLESAGAAAAAEARRLAELLPLAREGLDQLAQMNRDELMAKVERAGERWAQAIPTSEDPAASIAAAGIEQAYEILAADGSQVYPNRHEGPLYYLINIGSIRTRVGSGAAPVTASRPLFRFEVDDLYDEQGALVSSELINGLRDAAEMAELARLAEPCQAPCLALLDNGLLLWLALQVRDQPSRSADLVLKSYLEQLGRIRQSGASVAGVIDRPRHANVVGLIHLARMPLDSIDAETIRANPLRGLTDRMLFAQALPLEHRSALFRYGSPLNKDFERAGHEVLFFYLHSAPNTILRVEVPAWVASDRDQLDLVHSAILADSRSTLGFPYSLARAHELALVGQPERVHLERMIAISMQRAGLAPTRSSKDQAKRWLNQRRRHQL